MIRNREIKKAIPKDSKTLYPAKPPKLKEMTMTKIFCLKKLKKIKNGLVHLCLD